MHRLLFSAVLVSLLFTLASTQPTLASWNQDGGNAQRTGYTQEEPATPWILRWKFNGPDNTGKVSCPNNDPTRGHCYDAPREARTITGATYVFVPAGSWGFYALNQSNGQVAWRLSSASYDATPAFHNGWLYAATKNGLVQKINPDTGQILGSFNTNGTITKSLMAHNNFVYVVTDSSNLYKVDAGSMALVWQYSAPGSPAVGTPPAFSASKNLVIFATNDLFVHAISDSNGQQHWRVKPTPNTAGYPYEFSSGMPVVAEQAGVVFVRLNTGINSIFGPGTWPTTNAEIRTKLTASPQWKNLFALDLDTGQEKFIPAVGPGGTEDLLNGSPNLRMQAVPVVKTIGDKQVAYSHWRNGQVNPSSDERWNGNIGEMVLDNTTVSGYAAGDLRFIQFPTSTYAHIMDEQTPLTMAGNYLFHSHWSGVKPVRITDRSSSRGGTVSNPIATTAAPHVVRATYCTCTNEPFNASTHYYGSCPLAYDHGGTTCSGRYYGSGGFYGYLGILDPPTPKMDAYSDGIRPRYTYVSNGLIIFQGNGGEIMALSHSGAVATPSPAPSPVPTACQQADINGDGVVDLSDYSQIAINFLKTSGFTNPRADINGDGVVDLSDYSQIAINFLRVCN